MRWSWNRGAVVIPLVFSSSWTQSLRVPVVPAGDIRRPHARNRRGEHVGQREWSLPDRPSTILSPCSTVRRQRELQSSVAHGDSHPDPSCREAEGKIPRPKRLAGGIPGDRPQNKTTRTLTRSLTIRPYPERPEASSCQKQHGQR